MSGCGPQTRSQCARRRDHSVDKPAKPASTTKRTKRATAADADVVVVDEDKTVAPTRRPVRKCMICLECEIEGHNDLAWNFPANCHYAHLRCILQTLSFDTTEIGSKLALRIFVCPSRCVHPNPAKHQYAYKVARPGPWFHFFEIKVEGSQNFVDRCDDKLFKSSCPGCGKEFTVPRSFYNHVLACTDGSRIQVRCPSGACRCFFALGSDPQASYMNHLEDDCIRYCDVVGLLFPLSSPCVQLTLLVCSVTWSAVVSSGFATIRTANAASPANM